MAGLIIAYGVNSFANVLMASTYSLAPLLALQHTRTHLRIRLRLPPRVGASSCARMRLEKERAWPLRLGI